MEMCGWLAVFKDLPTMTTELTGSPDLGFVINRSIAQYTVQAGGRAVACTLAASLRPAAGPRREPRRAEPAESVAVGDVVRWVPAPGQAGVIVDVLPRRNQIARRSAVPMPGAHAHEQVIVANVDQVVPVFAAARPAPKWNLLDRYLTLAESLELPALVVLTKADLAEPDEAELAEALDEYRRLGYPVVVTSAVTGQGLDELRQALRGRVSVLLGKSGVGKTSLLNALEPDLGQRVAEVSAVTGKGRHTTSQARLFPLALGGALADTPGTREFGLWDLDPEALALLFPEMRPWVGQCRFGLDCRHDEEPGCAIRQAVMRGQISPRRYHSYLRLRAEV
jgi:ribosome biogenesis GTPase